MKQETLPGQTKIVFSGNSPREDLVDRIVGELRKHFRIDEQVEIALRLLSQPDVGEPPAFVDDFGEYQAMSARGLLDSTKKQNWAMARDDYFSKMEPDDARRGSE